MADTHAKHHDYHIIDPSPWPFIGSIGAFVMLFGLVGFMRGAAGNQFVVFGLDLAGPWLFFLGLAIVLYVMYAWWSDTIKEGREGAHTRVVSLHLRYGMIMFIASEVMFFAAWFWAFFDASLFPGEAVQPMRAEVLGGQWPPVGIDVLDPLHLPLFNTITLLLSGTTVTWAHHALLHNDRKGLVWGLALTIILGVIFSYVQFYEYAHAPFAFAGSIYGSTFFMATGFHGFHVIIGTIFLTVCLIRAMKGQFTPQKHFGFEAAAWYWHFVDVVWLFLFFCIYIWGSWGATIAEG
ncbi:cytochrome c oxidase subunit 3 [Aurantimonas sp. C2-6-R+9]|uniref:cytochrome c oxidase subunit 3 n=1 Tax=unclassified Aurantimonas TaxID=2638230 RepID=UPI002E176DC1|nr:MULTISPECIES: cytochrome c oxidase subunit 3 [unclassified Aurantimonas]MEC5289116.1 cytochrome c oxidase subunit 3 [Aurantimonas sp. C2-3-R2]MEC5321880.1 cytochrome c oxidase subunit 3 [Aurantimonas sp. A3-2-R12]MEC5379309.1 cytochrome c oxidase subunit 3 [Aurantimonas sp. C2-6-R+9]MEC5410062.1 cytochrome c oxidase subunit 3 [Aurantimonas sp. C2-4-R8]